MVTTGYEAKTNAALDATVNPFDTLLFACNHNAAQLAQAYEEVRATTFTRQTASFLATDFGGVEPDEILSRLVSGASYADPRFNVALISKPPSSIIGLIAEIQDRLRSLVPDVWFAPPDSLHMTSLEIAPALTEPECDAMVAALLGALDVHRLCSRPARDASVRTVLAHPRLTFDARALAVTFVPVASTAADGSLLDGYTYHHWRRDLWAALHDAGVPVRGRYVAASAHVTIARFVTTRISSGSGRQGGEQWPRRFVEGVANINAWLERLGAPNSPTGNDKHVEPPLAAQSGAPAGPETVWRVGEQTGLQLRCGRSWYGGGRIVVQGDAYC